VGGGVVGVLVGFWWENFGVEGGGGVGGGLRA